MTYEEAKTITTEHTRKLVEKWNKTGLLDGLKGDLPHCNKVILLEPQEGLHRIPEPTEEDLRLAEAYRIVNKRKHDNLPKTSSLQSEANANM